MDIVLKIIISLVVILAVGYTVINISTNMLSDSRNKIDDIEVIKTEEKLIEKNYFDSTELVHLTEKCYEDNYMIKNENLCFILKAENEIVITTIAGLPAYGVIEGDNAKTIYINYNNEKVIISD